MPSYAGQSQRSGASADNPQTDYDLRVIRNNLDKFKVCFETLISSIASKERYEAEFGKQVDVNSHQQTSFLKQNENLIENANSGMPLLKPADRTKDKSPASRLNSNIKDITSPISKVSSKEVTDLRHNNDQLFNELRKTNEKYLDVRVENNKLKDQILSLKQSLETSKQKEIKQ